MPMTIEKAIEFLQREYDTADRTVEPDFYDSLMLGIEALKLLAQEPSEGYTCIQRPIEGETKE